MEYWLIQILNSITLGMLLFLLASGFTIVFGLMQIANLAHGGLYLLGGYLCYTVTKYTGNFFFGVASGMLFVGIIGVVVYRTMLGGVRAHLSQVLLTIGLMFIFGDIALWIWGGRPLLVPKPGLFEGSISLFGSAFPLYRLFIIAVGLMIATFLWWFDRKTKYGAIIRAGVDDSEMVRGIGININLVMILVFGIGASLAALAGALGGPFMGLFPGEDTEVLLLALVVVVVGGPGSLAGAFFCAIMIGIVENLGKVIFPEISVFLIFVVMAIVLVVKPSGLFGK